MKPFSYGTDENASSGSIPSSFGLSAVSALSWPKWARSSCRCWRPESAQKSNIAGEVIRALIERSSHTVHPSLSQKCSHVWLVTRFPVHECETSWATTSASERSPASSVGVTKVRHGFSIPPYGNDGGRQRMSYRPHTYGWPVIASAAAMNFSVSANSCSAAATMLGSLHTCERGPTLRASSSPTASARRYDGIAHFCSKPKERVSSAAPPSLRFAPATFAPVPTALITAVAHAGTATVASYVNLALGVSAHGSSARAWIAWHCVNTYGRTFPAVSAGSSHWIADDSGDVA